MLKNCCFCIDLRTATLILSICGTLSHFYGAFSMSTLPNVDSDPVMWVISSYSWIAGFACLAGLVGVMRNNLTYLRVFSFYYWADLALNFFFSVVFSVVAFTVGKDVCTEIVNAPEQEGLDMETCLEVYQATSIAVVLAMGVSLLLKLHYSLAIHAYYLTIKHHTQQYISLPENTYIPVFSFPAAYAIVPQSDRRPEESDDEEEGSLPPAYSPAPSYPGVTGFDLKQSGVKI